MTCNPLLSPPTYIFVLNIRKRGALIMLESMNLDNLLVVKPQLTNNALLTLFAVAVHVLCDGFCYVPEVIMISSATIC